MYPAHLFNLFPPFPREEKVFVAMSFPPQFQGRWVNVIEPAIRELGLEPFRVDLRKISDSILMDITRSIANHRLVFGDISVMFTHETDTGKYPVRNPNVMYEVGLAHAVRLPEEVVLFRSDSDQLPFDVLNIRVNSYDPDGAPGEAMAKVRDALQEALREVNQSKLLAVEGAVRRLGFHGYGTLLEAKNNDGLSLRGSENVFQVLENMRRLSVISSLIEQGLLMGESSITEAIRVTPLGEAVLRSLDIKKMS